MDVRSAATTRASRNRIGACTRGPASRGGLGCPRRSGEEYFYSSPAWHGQSVCLTGVRPRMGVSDERVTEESYATLSWNQPPVKFKAERRLRGRCIGSREEVFGFNRSASTRPKRVLYNVFKRFRHFSSSPKKKKYAMCLILASLGRCEDCRFPHHPFVK